jgi:hypothetical protein
LICDAVNKRNAAGRMQLTGELRLPGMRRVHASTKNRGLADTAHI